MEDILVHLKTTWLAVSSKIKLGIVYILDLCKTLKSSEDESAPKPDGGAEADLAKFGQELKYPLTLKCNQRAGLRELMADSKFCISRGSSLW